MVINNNQFTPSGAALTEAEVKEVVLYMLQKYPIITQKQLQQLFKTNYVATAQDLAQSNTRKNECMYEQKIRNIRCHVHPTAKYNQGLPPNNYYLDSTQQILVDKTKEPVYYLPNVSHNRVQTIVANTTKNARTKTPTKKPSRFATFSKTGKRFYYQADKQLIGILGELYVMHYLRLNYPVQQVYYECHEEGNGCGYDICVKTTPEKLIEVKATPQDATTMISFTNTEVEVLSAAKSNNQEAYLYRVSELMYDPSLIHLLEDYNNDNTVDLSPLIHSIYGKLDIVPWDKVMLNIKVDYKCPKKQMKEILK